MKKYLALFILSFNSFAFVECLVIDHSIYSKISVTDETSFFLVSALRKDTLETEDLTYFAELQFDNDGFYAKKEQSWPCSDSAICQFRESLSLVSNHLEYSKYLEIGSDSSSEIIVGTNCNTATAAR